MSQRPAKRWSTWSASFAAWGSFAIFMTLQSVLYRKLAGRPAPGVRWFGSVAFSLTLWAIMTPMIVRLGQRFPLDRRKWPQNVGFHLLFALAFATVATAAEHGMRPWIGDHPELPFALRFFGDVAINVTSYVVIVAIGHAALYHNLSTERLLRASALETELAKAQLLALQMQLRPHFLFNALHTVGSLIRTGQDNAALQVLAGLGDLLRGLLQGENNAEIPLRQELDFIEEYLRIEQVRFQDRLRTHISVDPDTMDALVPSLILQPLVENAVRHGIEACEGEGELEIRVAREGQALRLEVRDSGTGPQGEAQGAGIGLGNTRARLSRLYGDDHQFELSRGAHGGGLASISIPFHRAQEPAS